MSTNTHKIADLRNELFDLSPEVAALAKLGKWTKDMYAECIACWQEASAKRDMSEQLRSRRATYKPTTAYSGKASLNNGDKVAALLAGMTPDEVLELAERICGLEAGELKAKYDHLNVGQQRMNGGNRIRGAVKRGDVTEDELPSFLVKQAI